MKTFKDKVLECENPKAVLKRIVVDGSKVEFKAEDFKSILLQDDLLASESGYYVHNEYIKRQGNTTLTATIGKINDNSLYIEISQECDCGGGGEMDCPVCDGIGTHYCPQCDEEHDCGNCDGTGGVECICVSNPIDDAILYHEVINLNQGELF